jgi:GNAT superfamily N-acetyltransferase
MERNAISFDGWTLAQLRDLSRAKDFDCSDDDLNEYFRRDVVAHKEQLLTETYFLSREDDSEQAIAALVDICNDAVNVRKMPESGLSLIPDIKRYPFLPAVKITRLGVSRSIQSLGVGTQIINMIKKLFVTDNRTGCRFVTVDAYNNPRTLNFYQKNYFSFFSDKDKDRQNRSMFFDLKRLSL